jgi:hydrogenase maturation protease
MVVPVRVLCLGNDLLADDAVGGVVAEHLRQSAPASVEVVYAANTGFDLIDYLLDTGRLVVVDAVLTGRVEPGTMLVVREADARAVRGDSPHYVGLFEALALARKLGLPAAAEVIIVAVEAADCTSVGGEMTPAVKAAVPALVELVRSVAGVPDEGWPGSARAASGAATGWGIGREPGPEA